VNDIEMEPDSQFRMIGRQAECIFHGWKVYEQRGAGKNALRVCLQDPAVDAAGPTEVVCIYDKSLRHEDPQSADLGVSVTNEGSTVNRCSGGG
jgi:hypothetical protein